MKTKLNLLSKLPLDSQRSVVGYLFVSPFIIGFLLFFLYPFFQSVLFSVSQLQITRSGFELEFIGIANYHHAVLIDPEFTRTFVESITMTLTNIPAVIIFSFFAAMLLNQKFRGRLLARVIFFLPVVMTAGIILQMEQGDLMHEAFAIGSGEEGAFFGGEVIEAFLWQMQLPEGFIEYIIDAVARIPDIINTSAIPILIFLAGLQSIPTALYECADIEGANAWDSFWKITFPLLSPLFLTNVVYIIIYSFTDVNNPIVGYIQNAAWGGGGGYGVSVAMSWIYFASIMIILAVVGGILSRKVVYMD